MPKIKFTQRFLKSYAHLPASVKEKLKKQIALLSENPRHPSLQAKPIKGVIGIYEARVDQDYRMTYERVEPDTLILRVIGKHDETIRRP